MGADLARAPRRELLMDRPALTTGSVAALAIAAAAVCLMPPQRAQAQDGVPGAEGPSTGSSEVLLGLGAANGAVYLGSDERKTQALPLIAASAPRWVRWQTCLSGSDGTKRSRDGQADLDPAIVR